MKAFSGEAIASSDNAYHLIPLFNATAPLYVSLPGIGEREYAIGPGSPAAR